MRRLLLDLIIAAAVIALAWEKSLKERVSEPPGSLRTIPDPPPSILVLLRLPPRAVHGCGIQTAEAYWIHRGQNGDRISGANFEPRFMAVGSQSSLAS